MPLPNNVTTRLPSGVNTETTSSIFANYPLPRAVLATGLHAWEFTCVGLAWWGVRAGWGRRWGRVEVALVVLVSCETMVATVGPFADSPPGGGGLFCACNAA